MWESYIDLIRQFAPDELKDFGVIWLNPSNIGDRVDALQELNDYFLFIVGSVDKALKADNLDDQDCIATFLDQTITEIIDQWLEEVEKYRIYPKADESPDHFPSNRIFEIMQLIMDSHIRPEIPSLGDLLFDVE